MTGLLVSVRSRLEAEIALAGGADLIDVKEPANGPLGRAETKACHDIGNCISGRAPLSLALGELLELQLDSAGAKSTIIPLGFQFAKVGLAGCESDRQWQADWLRIASLLRPGTTLIPVIYADSCEAKAPAPRDVLDIAFTGRSPFVLIDTFNKRGGALLDHLTMRALRTIANQCERQDIRLVLAGSLTQRTIQMVLPLDPAYVAVRGAACTGGRTGTIDLARVKTLRKILRGAAQKSRTRIA